MPRVKLDILGQGGLLTDPQPTQIPPNGVNIMQNAYWNNGSLRHVGGEKLLFNINVKPLYHFIFQPPGFQTRFFVISDGIKFTAYDESGTQGPISQPHGGGRVTFTVLNGVLVVNSSTDGAYYLDMMGGSAPPEFKPLPGWGADWRCQQLIAYKYYLVAIGCSVGGQVLPYYIIWSESADPGNIPQTWQPLASNDAGDNSLADTPGWIVAGVQVGNSLWIVKEDAIYSMDFVGGQYIHQFTKLTGVIGSRVPLGCCEFQGGLAILTSDDLYFFNGQSIRSLCDGYVKRKIFGTIGGDKWQFAKVFASSRRGILLLGIPESGSSSRLWDIYMLNVNDMAWGHKYFNYGYGFDEQFVTVKGTTQSPGILWDSTGKTWDGDPGQTWDIGPTDPDDKQLILYRGNATDTSWWIEVWNPYYYTDINGNAILTTVGRTGLPLIQNDQLIMVRDVWLEFVGNVAKANLYVGFNRAMEDNPYWQGPYQVEPNKTVKISPRLTGRFFGWRFEVNDPGNWRLSSLIIDYVPAGER